MLTACRYDTLGPDAVGYICGHAELSAVACSAESLGSLLEALPDRPSVKLVVSTCLPHFFKSEPASFATKFQCQGLSDDSPFASIFRATQLCHCQI